MWLLCRNNAKVLIVADDTVSNRGANMMIDKILMRKWIKLRLRQFDRGEGVIENISISFYAMFLISYWNMEAENRKIYFNVHQNQ